MFDNEKNSNYEEKTVDNVTSFITADNTKANAPYPSNIIVSQEQL